MKYCLLLLMFALAAPLTANLISAKATLEPQSAAPGGEVKLRLTFTVQDGYHAYHKDNPGYGKKLEVTFTELSGATQKGEAAWPKYHEWKDKDDPTWIEYELSGTFELAYTFTVPATAKDKLKIAGKYDALVCDEKGCTANTGEFSAEVPVTAAAPANDELISATAMFAAEGGKATPGKEVTLKLHFNVANTFHAYCKGNPGIGLPIKIEFSQLTGLIEKAQKWPDPALEFPDEKDKSNVEWELKGEFDIVFTFTVPSTAKDKLSVVGSFNAQVCDAEACQDKSGNFNAEIGVLAAEATTTGGDTKPLEAKIGALSDEVAALKKELADSRKATDELTKTLKDYVKAQQEKAAASGVRDVHGFYEDYDFALAEAKKQGKLLLVDFNGEY